MNKKLIISLAIIVAVAVTAIGATMAYFTDTETSTGNTFTAGTIDLKIDSECTYNGVKQEFCTWAAKDLETGNVFFNFADIKPGDEGEDTVSIHVDSNPAWVCAEIASVTNQENGCNNPEQKAGDITCGTPGITEGELLNNIYFTIWEDNGAGNGTSCDNIRNGAEKYLVQNALASDVTYPIADSQNGSGPIKDACIGVAWSVPSTVGNIIQGDSVKGDIIFKAIQARNNDTFTCMHTDGCFDQADVMLVLDRSGSISSTSLAQLKTAAHAFVTALNPNGGVHMGQTSFADTGTLDLHLTNNHAAIDAAIDALVSAGWTNLYEGLDLANAELDDTHEHERPLVKDYIVLITDGVPNRPLPSTTAKAVAKAEADAARAAGVEIYVVGVGDDIDEAYLKNEIADDAAHYFSAANYGALEALLQKIATCQ